MVLSYSALLSRRAEDDAGSPALRSASRSRKVVQPRDDRGALLGLRLLLGVFRRHVAGVESFEDQLPLPLVLGDRRHGRVVGEVQVGFRLGRAVGTRCNSDRGTASRAKNSALRVCRFVE